MHDPLAHSSPLHSEGDRDIITAAVGGSPSLELHGDDDGWCVGGRKASAGGEACGAAGTARPVCAAGVCWPSSVLVLGVQPADDDAPPAEEDEP